MVELLSTCIIEEVLLLGEHKVAVGTDSGAVGHKVGDRLHDIPAILPPGQAGQHAELYRHHT